MDTIDSKYAEFDLLGKIIEAALLSTFFFHLGMVYYKVALMSQILIFVSYASL